MKAVIFGALMLGLATAQATEKSPSLKLKDVVCVVVATDKATNERACGAAKFKKLSSPAMGAIMAQATVKTSNFEVTATSTTNGVAEDTLVYNQAVHVTSKDRTDSILLGNMTLNSSGAANLNDVLVQFVCMKKQDALDAGLCTK